MISRIFIGGGVSLAALLLLLAGINQFYFKDKFKPELTPINESQPLISKSASPKIKTVTSIDQIKNRTLQTATDESILLSQIDRNPFLWPEEKIAIERKNKTLAAQKTEKASHRKEKSQAKAKVERRKPVLKMIIIGEGSKIAMLDDSFVTEGSLYDGDRVKKIDAEKVILVGKNGKTELVLSKFRFPFAQRKHVKKVPPVSQKPKQKEMESEPQRETIKDNPSKKEMLDDLKRLYREDES